MFLAYQYLSELYSQELASRKNNRFQRYLKEATPPSVKQHGAFDFKAVNGMSQPQVLQLIQSLGCIMRGENILLFGANDIGKTHLACAIAYGLIDAGIRVKSTQATDLVQTLQRAKAELKVTEALICLDKFSALIVDDLRYVRKTEQESSAIGSVKPVKLIVVGPAKVVDALYSPLHQTQGAKNETFKRIPVPRNPAMLMR